MTGFCNSGNERPCSIKCGEFIDQLRNGRLLKKDSASWSKDNNNNNLSKK
jgi:hypothetical protein